MPITDLKTILVLEDEEGVMLFLRQMLKEYRLIEAASAEEALLLFNDCEQKIDLLLADVTLPASSGIHIALLLRVRLPDLPVVLTSGYPVSNWSRRDAANLERLGSKSVVILQKPFNVQETLRVINEVLGAATSEGAGTW